MARIRSVHPGQWTDEAFVSVSMAARLLCIALRNEADDNGVFEWKPLQIKMRLFPADPVDVAELLAELLSSGQVCCGEIEGRKYGAIRNFTKYQRPKKPNPIHPISDDFQIFVGLSTSSSPPVPHQFPTSTEDCSQMEEGGGNGKGKEDADASSVGNARGARLPDDWFPEPLPDDFIRKHGLTQQVVADEFEKFVDYWTAQPGARGRKSDWQATWRTWLRKATEYRPRGAPPDQRRKSAMRNTMDAIEEYFGNDGPSPETDNRNAAHRLAFFER